MWTKWGWICFYPVDNVGKVGKNPVILVITGDKPVDSVDIVTESNNLPYKKDYPISSNH